MATIDQTRDRLPQQPARSDLIASIMRDLVSILSLGTLLFCIHEFAPPFFRGFQCNDETIRYPYKDSTVSSGVCYLVGSGINVILILIVEYLNLIASNKRSNDEAGDNFQVMTYLRNIYCRLLVWFFGSLSSELITDITKVTAGRLRPHFIDVCKPKIYANMGVGIDFDNYCNQTLNPYEYITNYQCFDDSSKQRDARLSFLSGHSSYSAYSATFAVLYIQSAVDITKVGLFKPALQVLIASAAFYTGLTRVSDYKHHWQDVLAGLVLGTTLASLVSMHLWPALYKTYERFIVRPGQRAEPEQVGEELNRFSY